jgi:hypothetical protein
MLKILQGFQVGIKGKNSNPVIAQSKKPKSEKKP